MNMKKYLALLMAFALSAVPIAARADNLAYDDGTYEAFSALSRSAAPVVQFDAPPPGTGAYALDSASFYLDAAIPGIYPVAVRIWDDALAVVETIARDVNVTGSAMYTLDLSAAKLPLTGSVRIGIFLRDDVLVPVPGTLSLGADTVSQISFGHSFVYDSTIVPPAVPWAPDLAANYGIRASVHLVPALTCQGFLPPLNKTVRMKKGGRTLPLKALLFDKTGASVTHGLLSAPPLVQLLYASGAGVDPIDMTSAVAPAGRSNRGLAFRGTLGGKWIYNLKTKMNFPSGTYTVKMGSGDETEYVVDPTCTGTFVIGTPKPKKQRPPKGPR